MVSADRGQLDTVPFADGARKPMLFCHGAPYYRADYTGLTL